MRLPRLRTFVIFSLAVLGGTLLLDTSRRVQEAQERVQDMRAAVQEEAESLRVLKAEWATLNTPSRLEVLAEDYLGLGPPAPDSIVTDLPVPVQESAPEPAEPLMHTISQEATPPEEVVPAAQLAPKRKPPVPKNDFNALLGRLQSGEGEQ